MSSDCCNTDETNKKLKGHDHKNAIQERYGSAALEKESCLCTPVGFNPVLLEAIPEEVIESCLLYTSPSPRDGLLSRMPSSA